jgi:hypothetical protein
MEWWTSSEGDRIILVKLLVGDLVFNVISAYAPQIGLNESIKRRSILVPIFKNKRDV